MLVVILDSVNTEAKRSMGPTLRKVDEMINYYIALKTAISLVTGAITAAILTVCRVKLAILFGILAFMLNYVPSESFFSPF